jgi:hypothetical protein
VLCLNNLVKNVCHFHFAAVRMKVPATALARGVILGKLFLGTVLPFLELEEVRVRTDFLAVFYGDC